MSSAPQSPRDQALDIVYDYGERVVLAHDPAGDEGVVNAVLLHPAGIEYRVRWDVATMQWHAGVELARSQQVQITA